MDLLLIATYVGLCIIVFKVFRIPLNKWSVPTAFLGGVLLIGALLITMNYNHPYAKYAKEIFVTIPIVPVVRGPVIAVEVTANQHVKKGDVLFRIDPIPFQEEVLNKRARLEEMTQDDLAEEEALKAALARIDSARAERDRARQGYERFDRARQTISEQELEVRRQAYLSAEAQLTAAEADERALRLQTGAVFEGEDVQRAQARAELKTAEYELENTVVRAPADGMVMQLAIREGMMATQLPTFPLMTFIPEEKRKFVGSFWQNSMALIEPGYEVEVILDGVPGHVFKGKVEALLPAMSEGQMQGQGRLISAELLSENGRAIAVATLDESLDEYKLPRGVQGHMVVYTERFHHVAIIRRVLIRMMGWLNYVYPIK